MYVYDIILDEPSIKLQQEDKVILNTPKHRSYCCIDLHFKNMYFFIATQDRIMLYHYDLHTQPDYLLQIGRPKSDPQG
jgi:hypothetical protein